MDNDDKEVLQKQKREVSIESREKKFITSPADIEIHRKVELQDADINEAQQNAFKDLCTEFKDIFSTDSSDIGKTPLIEVEINTGDSLPIAQKPYTLPWASPIVVVPKRTAPGEPPKRRLCVDYRAVNSLLPPVKKAFSKAK